MINLQRHDVAGRYEGVQHNGKLVLRIDTGENESLDIIGGDLLIETSPGDFEFRNSFQTTALVLEDIDKGISAFTPFAFLLDHHP